MICLCIKLGLDLINKKLLAKTIIIHQFLVMGIITIPVNNRKNITLNSRKSKFQKVIKNKSSLRVVGKNMQTCLLKRKMIPKE